MKKYLTALKVCNHRRYEFISKLQNPLYIPKSLILPSHDIINCGTPRSGSTLLNMIVKKIMEFKCRSLEDYRESDAEYIAQLNNNVLFKIAKIHHHSPLIKYRIASGRSLGFFVHRDMRDILVSMIQKGWIDDLDQFIDSYQLHRLVNTSIIYGMTRNMVNFSYEELLNDQGDVINKICEVVDFRLTDEQKDEIISFVSIGNVKKLIGNEKENKRSLVGGDRLETSTGLHDNHIFDGRVGKWKDQLSGTHMKKINTIIRSYNKSFNYL